MDAPPLDAPYRVLEFKRELASRGIERGAREFVAAYPEVPMRASALAYRSARDYARGRAETYRELAPAGEAFTVDAPRTIGPGDGHGFSGRSRALFLACFRDAVVMGGSHLVRADGIALADFQDDERARAEDLPELDAGIFAVRGDTVHTLEPAAPPALEYDEAYVALLGPHSRAFGHWIWHQIPRFVASLESGALREMPVLVDSRMPATHFEALALAIGERAMPIVRVERGAAVRVRAAWFGSTLFYVPYVPRPDARGSWAFIATPPRRYLPVLRALAKSAQTVSASGHGRRIYLARRLDLRRKLLNAAAIEAIARAHGFAVIYPEEMGFAQQIAAIRDARYVTGPEGSAMFLNFYASPGTSIAILDHPFVAQIANYSAPLAAHGIDVTVIAGRVVDANDGPGFPNFGYKHFADYEIDPHTFDAFLKAWLAAA